MDEQLELFKQKLPRTIEWQGDRAVIIDQEKLPSELKFLEITSVEQMAEAIYQMNIRGAQAIEAAAACGLGLAAREFTGRDPDELRAYLEKQGALLTEVRPTAVNLAWAVKHCLQDLAGETTAELINNLNQTINQLLESEVEHNIEIGWVGAELIPDHARILTHCNAGSLSSIWYGTALAPIFTAHLAGQDIFVHVDETRPKLQGSRLTAWELERVGIDYAINVDGAAGYLMQQRKVDLVIVGADRIARNGDVANKIGTYSLAVLARENQIPFYVAAVSSTIDRNIVNGQEIPIEDRDPREVAPEGKNAENPAFDVTPAKLIAKIITEEGIHAPDNL